MHDHLDTFSNHRIAVIGDVMLDCYMAGEVSRISPEAPVPVMRVLEERVVPGGAANVAANLVSLGVGVNLVGLAGQDAGRNELLECLRAHGNVDCTGILAVANRRTTRKLRIIGAHQQIVRVDHEDVSSCDALIEERLVRAAKDAIDATDVVIVSDYGKGACSDHVLRSVFAHASATGKPVLVDPKRTDLTVYRGATVITPNRKELAEATRMPCETDEQAAAAALAAQRACRADILLTRSEKGMSFFPIHGDALHLPTVAQDVFDVSGAGDTVVAVLASAMAAGIPLVDGMRLANHAAGIVVSKLGTASVSREELAGALAAEHASPSVNDGRLVYLDAALALRAAWARDKLSVGFANGCFDLLHPGHVSLIRQAAESCDRLIMALNSDASVRRLKGSSRPVQDELARAAVMGAIKGVSAVLLFDDDTPLRVIEALKPDLLVKGADYSMDQVAGAETVIRRGGRVMLVDLSRGHSTSSLIAAAERR